MSNWRLICNKTGELVKPGDKRETFRGEAVTVGDFQPPHKPESSGKVQLIDGLDRSLFYYPGVIDCHYEQASETHH